MTLLKTYHLRQLLIDEKQALLGKWIDESQKDFPELRNEFIVNCMKELFNILLSTIQHNQHNGKNNIIVLSRRLAEFHIDKNYNVENFVLLLINCKKKFINLLQSVYPLDSDLKNATAKTNYIFDELFYEYITYYKNQSDRTSSEKNSFNNFTVHNERLKMLGQMTSSFVHEFKNPLTSIHGFVQLLQDEYPNMKYLNIISSEIEQLNFQLSQFLSLSKKEFKGKQKSQFSLSCLLNEVLEFLYPSLLDAKVTVKTDFPENIYVYGYIDEIRQVILNIIFNAIDVLNQSNNPEIKISVCKDNLEHICIIIANNGPMIPQHLAKTIFEPFVTTKKLGTGLGLFICKKIIKNHNGIITCDSSQDETLFKIKLPTTIN